MKEQLQLGLAGDEARPKGWAVAELGKLFAILDRMRVPINSEERSQRPGKVPYYGATGQVGWIDDHLFDEELILVGEDGAPFLDSLKPKAYVIEGKSWVNNHAHVLRALGATPSRFWKYQLDQIDYHNFVSGTTRLKLSQGPMQRIPLLVPPAEEQQRIVGALDAYTTRLDDAIATLKRVERNLDRYRASVLAAAVEGRLVPTEAALARAEGRDYEPARVLLDCVLIERRRRWEAAEHARMTARGEAPKGERWKARYKAPVEPELEGLPALPEGWCWATVDQLCWEAGYGTSQKCSYDASGPPVLRIPNLKRRRLACTDIKYAASTKGLKPFGEVEADDFLFIRTNGSVNLLGQGALVTQETPPGYHFASYLIRLRLVSIGDLPSWIAVAWHSPIGRRQIEADAASSAGQHNVSLGAARSYVLPVPPLAEQARIVAEIECVESLAWTASAAVAANISRCARLRQSILRAAFEGKLVDPDPTDEPASALLARIRAERAAAKPARKANASR